MYKVINLLGEEEVRTIDTGRKKKDLFHDYEGFVEKFEVKKTSDDCYTPDAVFDIVLNYVKSNCNISGREIVRPFYPGGDFEAIGYPKNCVVVDNPPFSIITKIARFYTTNDIDFFLFAPHMTLFSADVDCTHIVVGADIVYENGANVKTSFLSNLFGDKKIIGDPFLYQQLNALNQKVSLPKYEYPVNVLTVSQVSYMVEKGVYFEASKNSVKHWRQLDSQKPHGKALFGSGFLISEKAAAEKAAAEKAAAEKVNVITWQLSEKEKQVIGSLD
jgi:hypothetical protein